MIRRKVLSQISQTIFSTIYFLIAKDYVFICEYYNWQYKEMNKKRRSTNLYENFTKSHINKMKNL